MELITMEKWCTMKEIGKITWKMETENRPTLMVIYIKEISSKIKEMEKVTFFILVNFSMMAFSKKIPSQDSVLSKIEMEMSM